MGATKSKSYSATINDVVSNTIVENFAKCSVTVNQSQVLDLSGSSGANISNVSQKMAGTIKQECVISSQNMNALKDEIAANIAQTANAKNIALVGGNNTAESYSLVKTVVDSNINQRSVSDMVQSINQQQIINASNSIGATLNNYTQEMTTESMLKAISDNVNSMDLGKQLVVDLEQDTKSTSENPMTAIFEGVKGVLGTVGDIVTGPFKYIILLIVVIIASIFIIPSLFRGSSQQPYMQQPYMQQPYYGMYERHTGGGSNMVKDGVSPYVPLRFR